MKNRAFTLAELLITLAIIGVIAAVLAPAVGKLKPDQNKTLYLKSYDALSSAVTKISKDASLYSPYYEYKGMRYNVQHYPLLNTTAGIDKSFDKYKDDTKLGHILKDMLGGNANDSVSNFTTSNGVNWNISASETVYPATASDGFKFRNRVEIDVNGIKGPNSIYGANVQKPDRFVFYITADGKVLPADQYGQLYVDNRASFMRNKNEVAKINNYTDFVSKTIDNIPGAVIPKSEVVFNDTTELGDKTLTYNTNDPTANTIGTPQVSPTSTSGGPSCSTTCATHLNNTDAGIIKYKECMCTCKGGTECSIPTDPCAGKTGEQKDKCECEKANSNADAVKTCMCGKNYNSYCPSEPQKKPNLNACLYISQICDNVANDGSEICRQCLCHHNRDQFACAIMDCGNWRCKSKSDFYNGYCDDSTKACLCEHGFNAACTKETECSSANGDEEYYTCLYNRGYGHVNSRYRTMSTSDYNSYQCARGFSYYCDQASYPDFLQMCQEKYGKEYDCY